MLSLRPKFRADPDLEISVDEAFSGVARTAELRGVGRVGLKLPAGLRDGELVSLDGGVRVVIRIALEPGRVIMGDDLRLTHPVDPQLLEDGGRVEVETPYGTRVLWRAPGLASDTLLRVRDGGLPARDGWPQGHCFVRLEPDPALSGRLARDMLDRFTASWTPHGRRERKFA